MKTLGDFHDRDYGKLQITEFVGFLGGQGSGGDE